MGYGTGAIMAVPCGDQRDFEFARQFGLPIPPIQQPPDEWFADQRHRADARTRRRGREAFVGDAPYVNSSRTTTWTWTACRHRSPRPSARPTTGWRRNGARRGDDHLQAARLAVQPPALLGRAVPDRLRRRTATPHALPDDLLPLTLPDDRQLLAAHVRPRRRVLRARRARSTAWTGGSTSSSTWATGRKRYRRDTNVMPQWAGSCWYELRYLDPTNENALRRPGGRAVLDGSAAEPPDHPGGVDLYVGGVEHAVLHLLYARFWHKVLFDLGHVSSKEPYHRLFNQGYILAAAFKDERGIYVEALDVVRAATATFTFEGKPVTREWGKMGKSLKNAVVARRDLRGLRRRHAAPVRDGDGSAGRVPPVGDPRRRRHVPLPAAAVAQPGRRGRPAPAPSSTTAADDETRRLLHRTIDGVRDRHGGAALQHRDRQADRAEQPPHQARRLPAARSPSRWC